MSKNTKVAIVLIIICIIAGVFYIAVNRRLVIFEGWKPHLVNRKPSLNRVTVFPESFPSEARDIYTNNLAKIKDKLTTDSTNVLAWFDLALYYKMVGDNVGAVDVWKFIVDNYPDGGISLHNLGEHYFHEAKDYKIAEKYYRQSISVAPIMAINYTDLHDMYRYVYKTETTSAVDILKEGIARVSVETGIDLRVMLASYFLEKGNIEDAKVYYTEARDIAQRLENKSLVEQLNKELSKLK